MLQRWLTHELPDVRVRARDAGGVYETRSDAEGFFRIEMLAGSPPVDERGWHEVELDLPDFPTPDGKPAVAKVLVPAEEAQFGVISDIDDTVIFTAATNIFRMAKTVLLGTAFSRLPFKGVAAFYRGLGEGTAGKPVNPVFYVSSSPWNLYDVLRDLFEIRSIPSGPLMLQDFGIEPGKFITESHRVHKLRAIRGILETYPHLKFILVGDSGQKDPEIYRETVDLFPERILAVYIRDVSRKAARDEAIRVLADQMRGLPCELVLAEETYEVAQHALSKGWIDAKVLREIEQETEGEKKAQPIEKILQQQT
jgi:phosphatidate phosphatase APP1